MILWEIIRRSSYTSVCLLSCFFVCSNRWSGQFSFEVWRIYTADEFGSHDYFVAGIVCLLINILSALFASFSLIVLNVLLNCVLWKFTQIDKKYYRESVARRLLAIRPHARSEMFVDTRNFIVYVLSPSYLIDRRYVSKNFLEWTILQIFHRVFTYFMNYVYVREIFLRWTSTLKKNLPLKLTTWFVVWVELVRRLTTFPFG